LQFFHNRALPIGGWLAYKAYTERGPSIRIEFKTAAGLEAGKTKVKFKEVEVGKVTAIDLDKELRKVVVTRRTGRRGGAVSDPRDPLLGGASTGHRKPGVGPGYPAFRRLHRRRSGHGGRAGAGIRRTRGATLVHRFGAR